jgi:tripartite-type tricarboxylate transporter receptor subunit TctC
MPSKPLQPRLHRRQAIVRLAAGAAALSSLAVRAQADWPSRPIRLVVPYAPGGSSDTLGRMIAKHLQDTLRQNVVVENRAGAAGMIGSQQVARAAPDGYTLVVSGIASHVLAPVGNPSMFDPLKDFTHIAMLGGPPLGMVVNAQQPIADFKGFLAFAAASPQGVSWGSPGQGSHGHLTGELLREATKLNMVHISYSGGAPAVNDLVANQIPMGVMTLSSSNAQVDAGKLRLLAVSSSRRVVAYPNTPTFAELGLPQLTGTTWFSLSGPPGMPAAVVARLNETVRKGLQTPGLIKQLATESMETMDLDAAAFTQYVADEIARWGPAARMVSNRRG